MEYKVTTISNTTWTSAILSLLGTILGIAAVFVIGLLNTYYGAFVLTEFWKWFLALPGILPLLPIRLAVGLMLIVQLLFLGTFTALMLSMPDKPKTPGEATGILRALTRQATLAVVITLSWAIGAFWSWWLG